MRYLQFDQDTMKKILFATKHHAFNDKFPAGGLCFFSQCGMMTTLISRRLHAMDVLYVIFSVVIVIAVVAVAVNKKKKK